MIHPVTEPKRGVGRPNRISREQIVAQALSMLEAQGLEQFSIVKLARGLTSSPMAIYTYFGSRDDLLDACADAIFRQFAAPSSGMPWRTSIAEWLDALRILFERWPVALKLIKWDEHISPAWLRVWLPMVRTLSRTGLDGEQLAFAAAFVAKSGMGFIVGHLQGPSSRNMRDWLDGADVAADDQALLEIVVQIPPDGRRERLYAFNVERILAALDQLVDPDTAAQTEGER